MSWSHGPVLERISKSVFPVPGEAALAVLVVALATFSAATGCTPEPVKAAPDRTLGLLKRYDGPASSEDIQACIEGTKRASQCKTAPDRVLRVPVKVAVDRYYINAHDGWRQRIAQTFRCVNTLFAPARVQWIIADTAAWNPRTPHRTRTVDRLLMAELQERSVDEGLMIGIYLLDHLSVRHGGTAARTSGNRVLLGASPRVGTDCLGLANILGRMVGGEPVPGRGPWVIRRQAQETKMPSRDPAGKVLSMWRLHPRNVAAIRTHRAARVTRRGVRAPRSCRDHAARIHRCWTRGVEQQDQMIKITTRKCQEGDQRSCTWVGLLYHDGLGKVFKPDRAYAAKMFRQACREHVAAACFMLGNQFVSGDGVTRNPREGLRLLNRACKGGVWHACSNLGVMHRKGVGTAKNVALGFAFFELACNQGGTVKCYQVGAAYAHGTHGATRDFPRALKYHRLACSRDHGGSCAALGHMYRQGQGVSGSAGRAEALYRRACALKPRTCNNLGIMLLKKNLPRAVRLFDKACNAGSGTGCASLSTCYRQATGVPRDPVRARRLEHRSCKLGHRPACEYIERNP